MDRVATLSEDEYKILSLIRSTVKAGVISEQHHASTSMRSELEDLYYLMVESNGDNKDEIINRLYRMLW